MKPAWCATFILPVLFFLMTCPVSRDNPTSAMAQTTPPDLWDPGLISEGDRVFAENCSIPYCHGKEGGPGRAPALREQKWEASALRQIIMEGIPNSSMLSWNDKFNERQIRAVVSYVLSISGARQKSEPTTPGKAISSSLNRDASLPESLIGDPEQGEELFFQSSADCRRLRTGGPGVALPNRQSPT